MTTRVKRKQAPNSARIVRVGVDTGGTFTDFVFEFNGHLQIFKVPSTPSDPANAIIAGLERIAALTDSSQLEVVHGTTVGTNALLQRRGARTALITTKGFEDVLEIGRQARPELYNLNAVKPAPLVPHELRLGVRERIDSNGEILEELTPKEIARVVKQIKRSGAEAIAVSLLFSFANPLHERQLGKALATFDLPVSLSHQILPEYREYERTSTVTINSYLQPLMGDYLARLTETSAKKSGEAKNRKANYSFRVMQSSGGSISAVVAAREPVRTILSGPAGGIVGALRAAQTAGFQNIITFDMGGTSTDVALCDGGKLRMTNEAIVAGLPVAVPVMDIHTVGAGGGSIARVDEGGSLRVGPESAGADPGPACYGRSLLPTVTDAHVVLGHFAGAGLLGGEFELDAKRSTQALTSLAERMSEAAGRKVTVRHAASGILSVVNTNMERALRRVSIERGYDPRDFVLLPFGGAGGLHAVDLARGLRIPTIVAPAAPGALSAIGVVAADVVKDQSRTVMLEVRPGVAATLEKIFNELQQKMSRALRAEGFVEAKQRHARSLATRYKGQSFELEITKTNGDIAAAFHEAHEARYGYAQRENVVEIVAVRLRSTGMVRPLKQGRLTVKGPADNHTRSGANIVYDRATLAPRTILQTPCIVTEYSATTLIPAEASARVDDFGNVVIDIS